MKPAIATFLVGLAILAGLGALTLSKAAPRLVAVGAPGVRAISANGASSLEQTKGSPTICQPGEVLPKGVTAIRLSIWGFFGARVHVLAYSAKSQLLTEGSRTANWTSDSVTVPVRPLSHSTGQVKLCVKIGPNSEPQLLLGPQTPQKEAAVISESTQPVNLNPTNGQLLSGRIAVEYLAPGHKSWWSEIETVARRMGLGRAYTGTWIALLVAALMAAVTVLAVRFSLKELQ